MIQHTPYDNDSMSHTIIIINKLYTCNFNKGTFVKKSSCLDYGPLNDRQKWMA